MATSMAELGLTPPARSRWPRVELLIRADSHDAAPEVIDLCRSAGVDFILGLSTDPALRARVAALEGSTAARQTGSGKVRRFAEFFDAARSWCRVERIVARVEAGPQGVDTRFIVTMRLISALGLAVPSPAAAEQAPALDTGREAPDRGPSYEGRLVRT